MDATDQARSSRLGSAVWIAVAVGLALRTFEAVESSLWLDELHTLSHAAKPTLAAVAESVRQEVHTPLFFLFVHLFGAFEEGAWLRAIPVLSSLVVLWPLIDLARSSSAGGRTAILAGWLYACLPYQVHWASELRPYAWVGLFSAAAVWIAFTERSPRLVRFLLFFLCVLLGLYTHRIMAVTVFSIGAARLFVRRPGMLHLGWLILAGVLAVGPFLPWLVGFAGSATEARFDYQEEVGGYVLRPQLVKEVLALPLRLFVPYMGALGGPWAWLARVGAMLFFGVLGVALATRFAQRRSIGALSPAVRGVLLFALIDFFAVTALALWTWDRVPLQYYASLAWILPLAVAEIVAPLTSRVGRLATLGIAGTALALGVAQAGGQCTEDIRAGVAKVHEVGAELDAPLYSAYLTQPKSFDHGLAYLAYAPDLVYLEPGDLPRRGDPDFERPVVVLRRGTIDWKSFEELFVDRVVERDVPVDFYLSVLVLGPE
jgi:uncharacterized membrane protein